VGLLISEDLRGNFQVTGGNRVMSLDMIFPKSTEKVELRIENCYSSYISCYQSQVKQLIYFVNKHAINEIKKTKDMGSHFSYLLPTKLQDQLMYFSSYLESVAEENYPENKRLELIAI
jgi:hypothetical protein